MKENKLTHSQEYVSFKRSSMLPSANRPKVAKPLLLVFAYFQRFATFSSFSLFISKVSHLLWELPQ